MGISHDPRSAHICALLRSYGIDFVVASLTCYHAYSRCDTHGAVCKRRACILKINGRAPIEAVEHKEMMLTWPGSSDIGYLVSFAACFWLCHTIMLQAESFESVTIEKWVPMPEATAPPQPALYGIKKMVRARVLLTCPWIFL